MEKDVWVPWGMQWISDNTSLSNSRGVDIILNNSPGFMPSSQCEHTF